MTEISRQALYYILGGETHRRARTIGSRCIVPAGDDERGANEERMRVGVRNAIEDAIERERRAITSPRVRNIDMIFLFLSLVLLVV